MAKFSVELPGSEHRGMDAVKMYYPFLETWETSVLFKMRQQQHPIPSKCNRPQLHLVKCDD